MSNIATAKQTGQGGANYEDKVTAWFMACMLTETSPFSGSGIIKKISQQTRVDGWLLDDILLTFETLKQDRHITISVKSNQQINSKGIPKDLNRLLWQLILHHETDVFHPDSDLLCLIQSPISPAVSSDLNLLLQHSTYQDPTTLHKRILTEGFVSKSCRNLYESFYCPPDLAKRYRVKREDTGNLLRSFLQQEMDFENQVSKDETRAIAVCRESLKNKKQELAERLFADLCSISRKLAPLAGSLDRKKLIGLLVNDYDLIDSPSYDADWKRLKEIIKEKFSIISGTLCGQLELTKSSLIKKLQSEISKNAGIIIQGISGAGKTNFSKLFAMQKTGEGASVIWLDSTDFESGSMEAQMQIKHPLTELIDNHFNPESYLFIDGFEHLFRQGAQQKLGIILKKAMKDESVWKIIITCPSDQLDKLGSFLKTADLSSSLFKPFDIPDLSMDELLLIDESFPALHQILYTDSMKNIRNNLKLLDKLIRNADQLSDISATQNPGESHLIDFIWSEEVEKSESGLQISSFLKQMAEKQADDLSIGISLSAFSQAEMVPADKSRTIGLIRKKHESLYFNHDLYGDWARYKLIKSQRENLTDFLKPKHLTSPLWAKGVRLYGMSLLEQEIQGETWLGAFRRFSDNSPQHILVQDLLIEAFFFSPNAYWLMEIHKEILFADKGVLLKRMTSLFLLRATRATSYVIGLADTLGITRNEAASFERVPIAIYWPDVLKFLSGERDRVISCNLLTVVQITTLWLKNTPDNFPLRKEAANLSLKAAEKIYSFRQKGVYLDDELEEPVYKALLLSYPENKEPVRTLCLLICKRMPDTEGKENETKKLIDLPVRVAYGRGQGSKDDPWPLGPLARIDSAVRKICLDGTSIYPILKHNPALASEILLAVMIEDPKDVWSRSDRFHDHFSLVEEHGWYPPFYLRGPFLGFLRISTQEALSFICRLTDFATERWLKTESEERPVRIFSVSTGEERREYYGDFGVFGWHKDIGNAPHSLVSVLMALEQFFYEHSDNNQDINEHIEFLIKNTKSLAVIGVLFTIGKMNPELFLKELKPFLALHEFYEWDSQSGLHTLIVNNDFGRVWQDQAKKWRERPHRNRSLRDIVRHLSFVDEGFCNDLMNILEHWRHEMLEIQADGGQDIFFYQLIHQFNPANYLKKQNDNGVYFEYQEPAEVTAHLSSGRKAVDEMLLDSQTARRIQLMIDTQKPLDPNGAKLLWEKIQSDHARLNVASTGHCSGEHAWNSPYTDITAAIKLLLHHRPIWQAEHPEYLKWIFHFLSELIEKQFLWGGEFQTYGTPDDWNIILGDIVPVLWKENPSDKPTRRMIAGLLMLFNPATIKSFFKACALLFSWDDPDFVATQNLLLYYSGEYDRDIRNRQRFPKELTNIRNRLSEEFVEGRITNEIPDWSVIRGSRRRRPGINTTLVAAMFESIPAYPSLNGTSEKAYIVRLMECTFSQVIYQLGEINEQSVAIKSEETEFDRLALRYIAGFILYLPDKETRLKFWEPLFRYGYIAQDWIRTFCNAFFTNLDRTDVKAEMVELLNEMVEYTYISETWSAKHIDRSGDFRICVLGFHVWRRACWKYDYSSFTTPAGFIYKKWFAKKHLNPFAIDALLEFIITPSGLFMLKDGLFTLNFFFQMGLALSREPKPEGRTWIGHKDLDDKLASSLSSLWQYHSDILKKDKQTYQLYRELIQYLIAMQNIIGIELQNALVEE